MKICYDIVLKYVENLGVFYKDKYRMLKFS